jgi:hypothetical protein
MLQASHALARYGSTHHLAMVSVLHRFHEPRTTLSHSKPENPMHIVLLVLLILFILLLLLLVGTCVDQHHAVSHLAMGHLAVGQ